MKYSYSLNQEDYHGEFETREDAAQEAFSEEPDANTVWTAENATPAPEEWVCAENVIEYIQCQDGFSGEWAETWPGETKEQRDELEAALRKVFAEWMDRHGLRPNFYNVDKVQKHSR